MFVSDLFLPGPGGGGGGGGGGGLPSISYIGMRRHWVGFLRRLGLKTGLHFTDFDLKSGWVFERTTGVYEHFCRFNSK